MAHEIDRMAYRGDVPWHGLGETMRDGESIEAWRERAGLKWEAIKCLAHYRTPPGSDGEERGAVRAAVGNYVLARSDTGAALGIVSDRYQPVQPGEVIEFYRSLCDANGFELETAGSLRGGKRVWALAKTPEGFTLPGGDAVRGYLLLATSYDGTAATSARYTSVRVVCANTLAMANRDAATVTVRHNTKFNATDAKLRLGVHDAAGEFEQGARTLATAKANIATTTAVWLAAYFGKSQAEMNATSETRKQGEKLLRALVPALHNAPGAALDSSAGTLWGAVNAVTYHVDHARRARSQENRLDAAWFGTGDAIKRAAWEAALRVAKGEAVLA